MSEITFEQLPATIGEMAARLERIEEMLIKFSVPNLPEDCFMTVNDAANFLKLSTSTVYGKVCRGGDSIQQKG